LRRGDPDPDDRFRGLYVTDAHIDEILAGPPPSAGCGPWGPPVDAELEKLERRADELEASGARLELRRLGRAFGLEPLDLSLLVTALAPDVDPRFEQLFGYLNDDVTRKRASVGLAIRLAGATVDDGPARARLGAGAPLVAEGLVVIEDLDQPALRRALRVPDRVVAHLLGDTSPDGLVRLILDPMATETEQAWSRSDALATVQKALTTDRPFIYLFEGAGSSATDLLRAATAPLGRQVIAVDLSLLPPDEAPGLAVTSVLREALLTNAIPLLGPSELLAARDHVALRQVARHPGPVVMRGRATWDPDWSHVPPLVLEVTPLPVAARREVWTAALGPADPSVTEMTAAFNLTPEQVIRAARSARQSAYAHDRNVGLEDVLAGARGQNAGGLERLARRVRPQYHFEDLVLPPGVIDQLDDIVARVRHRHTVLDEWGMEKVASRARGVTALFSGESGTGKTMSAEVIAGSLGLDLYVVELATVIDKYIGETEKNLDRIFNEADQVNAVLLFDEADAIFGKRSEVKDAHDRYANTEIAYLLQRMERFQGVAVLTTNLRANLDEAFLRRIDALVEFPMPGESDRRRLWDRSLPASLPRGPDLDLEFMARSFELPGGNIRNIALAAAFLAASDRRPVGMADLVRATGREYRKLGRLTVASEFGPYHALLSPTAGRPPT
jgi:hypothetical protein